MQAVFETRDSAFGALCMLGMNNMTGSGREFDIDRVSWPRPSRACAAQRPSMTHRGAPCTDYCYAKHGFEHVPFSSVTSQETSQAVMDQTVDDVLADVQKDLISQKRLEKRLETRLSKRLSSANHQALVKAPRGGAGGAWRTSVITSSMVLPTC